MPALPLLASALCTIAFAGSGAVCLRHCVALAGPATPVDRVNDGTHVLMSLEMIAMAWSWFLPDRWGIQVAVFGTAAGWFLLQAIGAPTTLAALRPAGALAVAGATSIPPVGTGGGDHRGHGGHPGHGTLRRTVCLHHAILMLVMVWMLGLVTHSGRSGAMASMAMPTAGLSSRTVGVVVGCYCVVVAPLWAVLSIRAGRRRGGAAVARDVVTYPLMTAAMGAMVLLMR